MAKKFVSAYSYNMIPESQEEGGGSWVKLTKEQVVATLKEGNWELEIGHPDTATMLEAELGVSGLHSRKDLTILPGDKLLLVQLRGDRLPPGTKVLPAGARFTYYLIDIK